MQVDVIDQTGKKVSTVELNSKIFEAPVNLSLIAQAIRVRLTNARAGTANVKVRDEVSGGGRKPWRQKGTGRARQGSIRAPQWRGGGVVHGPRARLFQMVMPKQMRRGALFASLSGKVRDNQLIVLDSLSVDKGKTSAMKAVIDALSVSRSGLIVLPEKSPEIERAARNLSDVKIITARVLHPYEVLKYQHVVLLKDSLPVLEQTFLQNKVAATASKAPATKATEVASDKPTAAKQKASPKKVASTGKATAAKKPAAVKSTKAKAEK
jgi:large subunit ribosomal protein L4